MSALERGDREAEVWRILDITGSREVNGNETEGQMQDIRDKQEPRS